MADLRQCYNIKKSRKMLRQAPVIMQNNQAEVVLGTTGPSQLDFLSPFSLLLSDDGKIRSFYREIG